MMKVSARLQQSLVMLLALVFLLCGAAHAQYTTASLTGIVTDSTGAAVPGAKVTIQNTGTGMVRSMMTSQNGSYLFPALPVGTYQMTVEKTGFSTYKQQGITLPRLCKG